MTALSLAIYGAGLAAIFVWYALPNLNRRLVVGALITILLAGLLSLRFRSGPCTHFVKPSSVGTSFVLTA